MWGSTRSDSESLHMRLVFKILLFRFSEFTQSSYGLTISRWFVCLCLWISRAFVICKSVIRGDMEYKVSKQSQKREVLLPVKENHRLILSVMWEVNSPPGQTAVTAKQQWLLWMARNRTFGSSIQRCVVVCPQGNSEACRFRDSWIQVSTLAAALKLLAGKLGTLHGSST